MAAGRKLGDAYIAVTADARGVGDELSKRASKALEDAARKMGETLDDSVREAVEDSTDGLGDTLGDELERGTERAGGRFATSLRKNLDKALADLPEITLGADASTADQTLAGIREQLSLLRDSKVGVDVSTADAVARITALQGQLSALSAAAADVDVRADTAAAAAALAAIQGQVASLDGQTVNLRANTGGLAGISSVATLSNSTLRGLILTALALAPALIPIGAAALAGIGAIGPLAVGALAGLSALLIGFQGVGDAVKLLGQREDTLAQQAAASAGSQVSSAGAIASAQAALANTQANAADDAVRAAERVTRAVEDEQRATVDAARAIADAQQRAAAGVADALRRQETAERTLVSALRAARGAQEDLTNARRSASRQLEELADGVADNARAQRAAVNDVRDAQLELNAVLRNRRATDAQRDAAQLNYETQADRLADLQRAGRRLAEDQAEAAAKGVEGSDRVVDARQRVLDTEQGLADAQANSAAAAVAVDKARADGAALVARAQEESARRIIDAQRSVTDALTQQTTQARNAAFSIEQATRSVAASMTSGGAAGGAALAMIDRELDQLNPATRAFAEYVQGTLLPAWEQLKGAAAGGLLPGAQAGLEALMPLVPRLEGFLSKMGTTLGGILTRAGEELNSPFWSQFFSWVGDTAGPAVEGLASALGDIIEGFAGIVMAFGPVGEDVGGGLLDLTRRFAEWGKGLADNPDFKAFVAYVQENWPNVRDLISNVVDIVKDLVVSGSGVGSGVLDALVKLTDVINMIPPDVLVGLITAFVGMQVAKTAAGPISKFTAGVQGLLGVNTKAAEDLAKTGDQLVNWGTKARGAYQQMKELPGKLSAFTTKAGEVGSSAARMASRVGNGAAQIARSSASVVASGARMAASAAVTATRVVAGWVLMGAQSLAQAARMAAAWFIALGPIGWITAAVIGIVVLIAANWSKVKKFTVDAFNAIVKKVTGAFRSVVDGVSSGISNVIGFVSGLPGKVLSALGNLGSLLLGAGGDLMRGFVNGISDAASFVGNVAKNVVNAVIRFANRHVIGGINDLLEFTVAGITINPPDIPRIPLLADGAIVNGPTLAVVGEAGPEAVIPLSANRAARRSALMDEAGLGGDGGPALQVDARQTYIVRDTQTAEEVGAVVGTRVVRDIRNGVSGRYGVGTAA